MYFGPKMAEVGGFSGPWLKKNWKSMRDSLGVLLNNFVYPKKKKKKKEDS